MRRRNPIEPVDEYHYFLMYLYIAIAKADYHLVEEEFHTIEHKLGFKEKFPHIDIHQLMQKVISEHAFHTDDEIRHYIKTYVENHFPQAEDRQALLHNLEEIIEADGIVKDLEMVMLRYIKRVLQ